MEFTWQNGRQLATFKKNNQTTTYTYDADGIRMKKVTPGQQVNYYVANGMLLGESRTTGGTLTYLYDESGVMYGFALNGTNYYYLHNGQGDVIGLVENGVQTVQYSYDSWGKLLSVTDMNGSAITNTLHPAHINPIRYRGYYYDTESGLYYLQSRYYDPETGRFINADDASIIDGSNTHILENNLFAYCFNNPVNMTDEDGYWPSWATKLIVGTVVIAAAAVLTVATAGTGTTLACFAFGALKGAAIGAAVGAASGAATGAIGHRVTTGSWKGAGKAALESAADGYMTGAVTGFVSGGLSSNVCFVAGTAVLTSTGCAAIETVKEGDYVWATDPEMGTVSLKQVVQTFVNETTELIHVAVNGEKIICTTEHPFYSPGKGWTAACKLRAGDILVTVNGKYVVVEQIQREILERPIKVYNFEVADFHTYYVGNTNILVHNMCKQARITNVPKAQSKIWNGLKNAKNGLRTSGSGRNIRYYSWDNLHNEIEVFDRLGKHLGAIDPSTGAWIKQAVKGRYIKI